MAHKDFIPRSDPDFNIFQANLITIITPNVTAWGILAADLTALTPFQTAWATAFNKANNKTNRTSADIQAKDDTRKIYEKAMRNFLAQWITRNPRVPDSERERIGLNIRDTNPTRSFNVEESSSPIGKIDFSIRMQHTINFVDSNSPRSKAKPNGIHGCEIWTKLGGEAPVNASELIFVATDTRTPYVLHYTGTDGGKIAYYWLRWVSNTGICGPWGAPVSAAVVA